MSVTIKGESEEYRKLRNQLLEAEISLKDQREKVAQLRRTLPLGTKVEADYVFLEGPKDLRENDTSHFFETNFSSLFEKDKPDLIIDHMMFAPNSNDGCPMCSLWADGYNTFAPHIAEKANFVLIARAPLEKLRAWALKRGWHNLRLLSSVSNTFNHDFNVEITSERQLPAVSVFRRLPDETIHHFYTTEASLSETHHRGIDLFNPIWHLFDLLPKGRGDWLPGSMTDPCCRC